jgi:hypothetical protein
MWILVARIAPEPVNTSLAVTGSRSRADYSDPRPTLVAENDLLPPVPAPVPTPVPAPAIVPPNQAFVAALLAEQLPARAPSLAEVNVRFSGGWKAPGSPLRLTDRRV